MAEILDAMIKRSRRIKKEKKELIKKYNSLSLVEKNAYDEIIDRRSNNSLYAVELPLGILKLIFYFGIFFIVFSIMTGISLDIIRESYINLVGTLMIFIIPLFIAGLMVDIIHIGQRQSIKKRLLNKT